MYPVQQLKFFLEHKDYLRVIPLKKIPHGQVTTHLFDDRPNNNSLTSTFMKKQEPRNETTKLTHRDFQKPSYFINEEIVEKIPTTTWQSFSPIHHTIILKT